MPAGHRGGFNPFRKGGKFATATSADGSSDRGAAAIAASLGVTNEAIGSTSEQVNAAIRAVAGRGGSSEAPAAPPVRTLPSGTMSGSEASLKAWAKDSAVTRAFYHYSNNRDAVISEGFDMRRDRSIGGSDGMYLMDDAATLGDGTYQGKPVQLYLNLPKRAFFNFSSQTPEDEARIAEALVATGVDADAFGEPGTVGQVLRYAGYQAWTDGYQYAALDQRIMGIVDDASA